VWLQVKRIVNPGMVAGNLGQAVKLKGVCSATTAPTVGGAAIDLPGCSVAVTIPGVYKVVGRYDILAQAAALNAYGLGTIVVGGAGNTLDANICVLALNQVNDRMTLTAEGFATFPDVGGGAVAAGSLMKLQGQASGAACAFQTLHTGIHAHRIGSV
jgi:hypothetical protein